MERVTSNEHSRNAAESLNHMLGQPPYQITNVVYERTQSEIPDDLTRHITQTVNQAPSIRQMQIAVDRHTDEITQHRDNCNVTPRRECETYTNLRTAYERANRDHRLAIRAQETALRAAFNVSDQLQRQESVAMLILEQAIADYSNTQLNRSLGRATQFEVDNAINSVFIAEQAIERILYQRWVHEFTLANPALLY